MRLTPEQQQQYRAEERWRSDEDYQNDSTRALRRIRLILDDGHHAGGEEEFYRRLNTLMFDIGGIAAEVRRAYQNPG